MKHLYLLLIRPHLEYACTVWDPFLQKYIQLLEKHLQQTVDCYNATVNNILNAQLFHYSSVQPNN